MINGIRLTARSTDKMTGITGPNYKLPKELQNEFQFFFSSIFEDLKDLIWVYSAESFCQYFWSIKDISDEEIDAYEEEYYTLFENPVGESEYYFYYEKPDFFQRYSKYIKDDWNDFWGFDKNSFGIIDLKNQDFGFDLNDVTIKKTSVCFTNNDASYWACFSKNLEVLNKISDYNAVKSFIKIENLTLSEEIKARDDNCFDISGLPEEDQKMIRDMQLMVKDMVEPMMKRLEDIE